MAKRKTAPPDLAAQPVEQEIGIQQPVKPHEEIYREWLINLEERDGEVVYCVYHPGDDEKEFPMIVPTLEEARKWVNREIAGATFEQVELGTVIDTIQADLDAGVNAGVNAAELRYNVGKMVRNFYLTRMATVLELRKHQERVEDIPFLQVSIGGSLEREAGSPQVVFREIRTALKRRGITTKNYNFTRACKQWALCELLPQAKQLNAGVAEKLHKFVMVKWKGDGEAQWNEDETEHGAKPLCEQLVSNAIQKGWEIKHMLEAIKTLKEAGKSKVEKDKAEAEATKKRFESMVEKITDLPERELVILLKELKRQKQNKIAKLQTACRIATFEGKVDAPSTKDDSLSRQHKEDEDDYKEAAK